MVLKVIQVTDRPLYVEFAKCKDLHDPDVETSWTYEQFPLGPNGRLPRAGAHGRIAGGNFYRADRVFLVHETGKRVCMKDRTGQIDMDLDEAEAARGRIGIVE